MESERHDDSPSNEAKRGWNHRLWYYYFGLDKFSFLPFLLVFAEINCSNCRLLFRSTLLSLEVLPSFSKTSCWVKFSKLLSLGEVRHVSVKNPHSTKVWVDVLLDVALSTNRTSIISKRNQASSSIAERIILKLKINPSKIKILIVYVDLNSPGEEKAVSCPT